MFDFTSTGLKTWSSIAINVSCVRQQDSYWQQWMATKYSFLSSEHYSLHCASLKLSTGNHKTTLSKVNCMPLYSNIVLTRSNFTEVHLFPAFSVLESSLLIILVLGFGFFSCCEPQCKALCPRWKNRFWIMGHYPSFLGYSLGHTRLHWKHLAGKCQLGYTYRIHNRVCILIYTILALCISWIICK